ncbi:hypothetical protein G6K88_18480 [Agrobacterium rhizogenes]|jgi:hypothetical protein|uniref:hypothetical protein n=1 Tax=Rhizobium rhizogenes TaxID=359 RepID=UPI00115D515B|nr:hypothetical protein [Rhizobium rhizogenes]NTG29252.1 hypothetical protein [Rhizobium rhizogenes]NTG42877.1 hypothetical protein [Rhizobium rhizogenes]NTI04010.1 hypothetical protein [Rhizobium rhizogenes]NTI10816.1 hypothetical protein [Rhizobium rhizogenes]TRB20776.1 hypothetical protein EXN70_24150 [Rhizobium rhizogenes]
MSHVYNYALFTTLIDEWLGEAQDLHALQALNQALARERENDQQNFTEVHQHAGGSKSFGAFCYMLAGNHIPLHVVAKAIVQVPWRDPESIMLVFSDERYEGFHALYLDRLQAISEGRSEELGDVDKVR